MAKKKGDPRYNRHGNLRQKHGGTSTKDLQTTTKEATFSKEDDATKFKIIIPDSVYQKVMWWVNKSSSEVSWFGDVKVDHEKREFIIKNAELAKQVNGASTTDIDESAMCQKIYEKRADPNALKWWGHSHVNMPVFWSGTDKETIRELGRQGWIIATVFNKKQEMRSAYLQSVDVLGQSHDIFVDEVKTTIQRFLDQQECEQWDKEYADNVSERSLSGGTSYKPGTVTIWEKGVKTTYSKEAYDKLYDSKGEKRTTQTVIDDAMDSMNNLSEAEWNERYEGIYWPTDWGNMEEVQMFYASMDDIPNITEYEKAELENQLGSGYFGVFGNSEV